MAFDPQIRIAIIGAGPAGLTAAQELREQGYQNITLFEANTRVGGKSISVNYQDADMEKSVSIEGGTASALEGKVARRYARKFGLEHDLEDTPPVRYFDFETGRSHHPLSSSKHSFARKATELLHFLDRHRIHRGLGKPGLAHINKPEASLSVEQWLSRYDFEYMRKVFLPTHMMLFYGHMPQNFPALYWLKYNALSLPNGIRRISRGVFQRFKSGNQELWRRVAREHDVRLGEGVIKVERQDDVRIQTHKGTYEFDKLIWSAPLSHAFKTFDISAEERSIFSRIRHLRRGVLTYRIEGLPKNLVWGFPQISLQKKIGYPYAMASLGNEGIYSFYPFMDEQTTVPEMQQRIQEVVEKLGGKILQPIGPTFLWQWHPYFSCEDVKAGIFERLEALQGQNDTYFVGEALSGVSIPFVTEYSAHMVDRFFARPSIIDEVDEETRVGDIPAFFPSY